jgi:hypothetical protein
MGYVKTVRTSQPCIADQMLGTAAILGGKGRGTGLKFAHHIVAHRRRCEWSREDSRQLEGRLIRQAPAYD